MKVKELKELLDTVPDDLNVLIECDDPYCPIFYKGNKKGYEKQTFSLEYSPNVDLKNNTLTFSTY